MSKARLSSKNQLTVPIDVRRMLGLEQGDTVIFEPTERGVLMRNASREIAELYGSVPALKMPWKEVREKAWRLRAEEIVKRSSAIASHD